MKAKRNQLLAFLDIWAIILAAVVLLVSPCMDKAFADASAQVLEFSDMSVETNSRTGFFGGQYASFEISGYITNNTDKPVNRDNLPALIWIDQYGDERKLKADITQDKLLAGESCDVTYEDELSVRDGSVPKLSFSGRVEFKGLKKTESKLNSGLQKIAAEFADKDAEKEKEKKAEEEKADNLDSDKKALKGYKGKYAIKAYNAAKKTGYDIKIVDSQGNNVTRSLESSKKGDPIRKAKVKSIKFTEAGWFSDPSVQFTIDYEDPEAKAEREAREAKKRQEEAEKALLESATKGEQNAYKAAKRYLAYTAFSYSGLIDQLEFEGYTTEEATFAADNIGADWNEQALKNAKDYLEYTAFSYSGLINQLEFEKYTPEQATYAADNCGADWYVQAEKKAQDYLEFTEFSRDGLISQLQFEGFTYDQAAHGADSVGF